MLDNLNKMIIHNKIISNKKPPFIVAEISANHNNNLKRALKLIDEAKKAGADAVKIQTYTADTITLDSKKRDFLITDKKSLWYGKYLYELYKKGSTPWEWHNEIFNRAKKNNLICFSTPFDETAVDFLRKFNPPVFKVASFENNHFPLIKKIIKTKKPIIISLGVSTLKDIQELVIYLRKNKAKNFALLKCTSSYPASVSDSNLKTILDIKKKFNVEVGLSDHTPGIGVAIASVAFGASIIEKHFTLNSNDGGLDDSFSINPSELNSLVCESRRAWESIGKKYYGILKSEENSIIFKRSIYASRNILKGEKFTKNNIKIIRPSFGISPKYFDKILGKKSLKSIEQATPIKKNYYNN
jgi:pseudaminic acid synthase